MIKRVEEKDFISGHTVHINGHNIWTQRLTDSYGLLFIYSGSCNISIGQDTLNAKSGDLILMHPRFRHSFQTSNAAMFWFHFVPRPHVMPLLDWPGKIPGLACIHLEETVSKSVKKELQEAHLLEKHHLTGWFMLACSLLETTLARGYNHLLSRKFEDIQHIQIVQKLLQKNKESIDKIAKKCGISRASLYTKFKQATGLSPQQYRESAILRHSMHLLEGTSMSIAQIVEDSRWGLNKL